MNDVCMSMEFTEKDDDGSYSSCVKITGFKTQEQAEMMASFMHNCITKKFHDNGLNPRSINAS